MLYEIKCWMGSLKADAPQDPFLLSLCCLYNSSFPCDLHQFIGCPKEAKTSQFSFGTAHRAFNSFLPVTFPFINSINFQGSSL